jgi:hypothetical protein
MKNQKSIYGDSIARLGLMIPVICLMAITACTSVADRAQTRWPVTFQRAVVGGPQSSDNVTIGSRTYNSESRGFDRPWPFGPNSSPQ